MRLLLATGLIFVGTVVSSAAVPTITDIQAEQWDREIESEGVKYSLHASEPRYVVPNSTFPAEMDINLSNNCVGIGSFQDILFMGFRSAPYHFASSTTRMFIVSSEDGGKTWKLEKKVELGSDVREPHFLNMPDGTFVFSYFEAGTNPLAFEPKGPQRMFYQSRGNWSDPEPWGKPDEVIW